MMDKRFYLLIGLAIAALTAAYLYYRRATFVPKNSGAVQRMQRDLKALDKELNPSTEKDVATRRKTIKKLIDWPVVGLSEHKRLELARALDAIEWRPDHTIMVEDVYFMMVTNFIIIFIASIIGGLIWTPLFAGIIVAFIAYNMPANRIKKIVAEDEKQMKWEFPDFFDIVYVQYREQDANILMSDIVDQYIPVAGPAFRNMLRRFSLDLSSGEDYALEQLDKRYLNNHTIHRFSSVMRQRLKGEAASFVAMDHFRDTLQADVHDWMFADLEKRKETAGRLTGILTTLILSVVMVVYFVCFFKTSTGM